MSGAAILSTFDEANQYLWGMHPKAQKRGDAYFRQGAVRQLSFVSDCEIRGQVQGSGPEPYEVMLDYDLEFGWQCDCSCPLGADCKHVYAAMKTLLTTRGIIWGQPAGGGKAKAGKGAAKAGKLSPFAQEVATGLQRDLLPAERQFIRRVEDTCRQCQKLGLISRWDFQNLGLSLGGNTWEPLDIWPAVPQTVMEFWLYVAHAAQQRGVPLPEFMQPVTKLEKIEAKLHAWLRQQEIVRWQQTLGTPRQLVVTDDSASVANYEIRVRLAESGAVLEWKRPGREKFETVKSTDFRGAYVMTSQTLPPMSPAGEVLWELFENHRNSGFGMTLSYGEPSAASLRRLFKVPEFAALLVNSAGQPFLSASERLRWQLDPAADVDGDYRLRVARADGTPLAGLLCVLDGRPPLFVTQDTVYDGPPAASQVLQVGGENVIPAPALETRAGVELLHSLGLEMPPRLRERVRTEPLRMVIDCEIKALYLGSNNEVCALAATAQTADGAIVERWNGQSWSRDEPKIAPGKVKKTPLITLYDRTGMRDAGTLFGGLDARWDGYLRAPFVRVNKKFPELFAAWLRSVPPEVTVNLAGDLASFTQDVIAGQVRLDVTETEIDWFDLRVVLDVADTTLTQEELKLLLNARGGFVRLPDKGWRRLQFNLSPEEDERLARLGLNPRELTAEPQRLHALQLADDAAKKFLPEQQFTEIQRRVGEIKARVTPEIPGAIQATLRPYQTEGFHFLAYLAENRFGGILADDMGLGKTLQTLTWLTWLRAGAVAETVPPERKARPAKAVPGPAATGLAPSLVVCPKSVMDNWRAETERFSPGVRVKIWRPSELPQFLEGLGTADLHVINYSQLRTMGESLIPVHWLALILDEGQYIKNPNSQTAQIARALKARHRLVLSGTPIENRLLDLWSLMAFAMPGVLGSRAQFARLYDSKEDPFARRRLSARVRPFLLRRTKVQVAKDLPDRIEEDLFCEMEGEQKTLYRAELKHAQQMLLQVKTQKQLAKERFHFLTSLLRLRQISCHPRLVRPESRAVSAKVEALLEQLEPLMEEGNKVLIFSQFVGMLDILREHLEPLKLPLFYLAGETENRGELVQRFQAAEGAAIFLISLKAGGFGLNLTAASYVVLFDPWWNPAVENQAIDRTHRIGQSRKVIAYRLLIKGSIEEKIRQMQKQKSALADDVLGEEKFSQSLTLDDLHFLFSDDPA